MDKPSILFMVLVPVLIGLIVLHLSPEERTITLCGSLLVHLFHSLKRFLSQEKKRWLESSGSESSSWSSSSSGG